MAVASGGRSVPDLNPLFWAGRRGAKEQWPVAIVSGTGTVVSSQWSVIVEMELALIEKRQNKAKSLGC